MAESRLGANFSIDITQLQAGLKTANKLIRESQSEFKAAAAGMDDWSHSEAGLNAKISSLNTQTSIQREKVRALKAEYQNLINNGLDPASDRAITLRTQINREEAALASNEKELRNNKQALKELGDQSVESGNKLEKFGQIAKTMGTAVVAALAAAGAAVFKLTKSAIDNYAEYEQLVGGVETLFGDSSQKVIEYANNAYKTAGMSANEYMETVTSFSASLLQGLGGDTEKAAEVANKALVDMSDNANKMGTDMEMIQNAYQGFAKQNYTMLDNLKLGYGGTQAEMARLINDSKVLGDVLVDERTVKNVSFDKIIEAIHVIQTNMGITGTTAKEASTTIQGSLSSMQAAWQNLLTGMADETADIDQLILNLVDSVGTFAENLLPRISVAMDGILKMVEKLLPEIPPLLEQFLPVLLEGVTNLLNGVIAILPQAIDTILKIVPQLITALLDMLPTILNAAISIVIQVVNTVDKMLPTVVDTVLKIIPILIKSLIGAIPQILEAAISLLMTVVKAVPIIITELLDVLPSLIDTIINTLLNAIPELINAVTTLFMTLVNAIPDVVQKLGQALPQIITIILTSLLNALPEVLNAAVTLLTAIVKAIPILLKGLVGALPSIIVAIVNALVNAIPLLLKTAITLLLTIVQAIPVLLAELYKEWPSVITTVIGALINAIPQVLQAAISLLMAVVDAIPVLITSLLETLPNVVVTIIQTLLSMFPELLEAGITLLMALIEAIPTIITELLVALPHIITTIVNTLIMAVPQIIQAAFTLLMGIVSAIPEVLPEIIAKIPEIITGIVDGLIDGIPQIIDAGADMLEGLFEGFVDPKMIWEQVKSLGNNILDGIKGFFGIKSPSKLMEKVIGKNLALGIGEGFENNIGDVNDQISKAIRLEDAKINIVRTISGEAGGKSVVVNQYNTYSQAHSRYELYQSKKQTAAAVRLALGTV